MVEPVTGCTDWQKINHKKAWIGFVSVHAVSCGAWNVQTKMKSKLRVL